MWFSHFIVTLYVHGVHVRKYMYVFFIINVYTIDDYYTKRDII